MKILVFTTLFPNNVLPTLGVFVKERMLAVAGMGGCEVRVIAPVPYHPPLQIGKRWSYSQVALEEVIDGVHIYHPRYFLIPKISMPFHGLMMFLSLLFFVKKIQAQFDFDIIDAHYVYPDGFAAVLLGRFFRKPVTVTARGSDINVFSQLVFIRRLLRTALQQADGVIAVSEALKTRIIDLGIPEKRITVVPNGVDPKKFYPVAKSLAREKLGLPNRRKLLLSVGALNSVKGFDHLIRAIKILIEELRVTDVLLLIVGEGRLRNRLLRMISTYSLDRHVQLVGSIAHAQLNMWYSAADVFCLASRSEGWPNVLVESLACGTPVVATSVGGIPEIIVNEEIGLLSGPEPSAFALRIREAIHKQWDRERIVHYSRSLSWDDTAASVCQVFGSILAPQSAPRDDLLAKEAQPFS